MSRKSQPLDYAVMGIVFVAAVAGIFFFDLPGLIAAGVEILLIGLWFRFRRRRQGETGA